ncbi:general substrate transporter [Neohortaea acidophila]|uniref:General substrate transporter n=1 Tax=Neohortaea acidophila TaxID=245834 RepID=A0A6A6PJM1_9PEZI|nr:general substrate transporter [Neohortaea acidophila]KAF2479884.1 general substrate transporter [Neohortaea acidophila]
MAIPSVLRGRESTSSDKSKDSAAAPHLANDQFPVTASSGQQYGKAQVVSVRTISMLVIVSLGGLIFGFDTGQISGFVAMPNFVKNFANNGTKFSNVREGTIVGLLSIGTLVGSVAAGPIADAFGRKKSIITWCVVFIIGVIIQIATMTSWIQIAVGRLVAGFGVGGLSVLTPMYQSETAPRQVRGAMISAYQLFITFGIFLAYCINYGTEAIQSRASWRITMGIGFIFPTVMIAGIMFLPESPRWEYRKGRIDSCRTTIAKSYGVPEDHPEVVKELHDIKEKFDAEMVNGVKAPWYEVFTGPRMAYRTLLGITLQALQQLTGANFFFYYGTSIFTSIGLSNSFVTSMILGGINFGSTFPGLYVVEHFGRRKALITGGLCMFVCFMIFASVGSFSLQPTATTDAAGTITYHNKTAGTVMIVFTCLFIVSYAMTWGPIVWALVAEIYPSQYRARSMGFATASNWIWNFLISFFTPFIVSDINFRYGYIFAACCFAGAVIVYLFVCESQGRRLEEIDTMYVTKVPPWRSSKWVPPADLLEGDKKVEGEQRDGDMERVEKV